MTTPTTQNPPQGLTTRSNNGRASNPQTEFRDVLVKMRPQLAAAMPKHLDPDRLLRIVLTAVRKTPALLNCTRESVLAGIMQAAQLGLEPDGQLGLAYLLPYGSQCQLIVGWKGLVELARRSGLVANVTAHCVHYGDFFEYELGLDPKLRHIPADVLDMPQYAREQKIADSMRGEEAMDVLSGNTKASKLVAAYAVVTMKDGTKHFRVVTKQLVMRIRAMSKGAGNPSSPWTVWEDQMWEKTAVKQALRFVPLSPEDKTLIEHADAGRTLSGIADVVPLERLAQEPLPPVDADGQVLDGTQTQDTGAGAAPETPAPAARRPGRPRGKPQPAAAAPESVISAPPAPPPPGPAAPSGDDPQGGLFGDQAADDAGPSEDPELEHA